MDFLPGCSDAADYAARIRSKLYDGLPQNEPLAGPHRDVTRAFPPSP